MSNDPNWARLAMLSKDTPLEQQLFVMRDRDGDYVQEFHSAGHATEHMYFIFTKDKRKAGQWHYDDILGRLLTNPAGIMFVRGYSGGSIIRIK